MANSLTVLGFLGTQLDAGRGPQRWSRWRPTVSLFQHDELLVDRLLLLVPREGAGDTVIADVRRLSPETRVQPVVLPLTDPWDFELVFAALHDLARQLPFDDDDELWVHITTGTHVAQICLFLLTESGFLPGKLLQTAPPTRQAQRGRYSVIDLDLARYESDRGAIRARAGAEHRISQDGIETRNPAFNTLIDQIEQVAGASTDPILLTGPTGAGKSRLARRIYELKRGRRQLSGPLVEVNCATLRGDQAMSALFGHTRGAFTGAQEPRAGLLATADQGLLFLDEIGELGLDEQAMLLRAVEDRRFLPVGADREVSSDFQLIAGSNRDLRAHVRDGKFREDLLARIDLWHFELPGLAERHEDIEPNLVYELERFAERSGRRVSFNREARRRFLRFATSDEALWRANFRDLTAAVTRLATLTPARPDRGSLGRPRDRPSAARLERGHSGPIAPGRHALGPARGRARSLRPRPAGRRPRGVCHLPHAVRGGSAAVRGEPHPPPHGQRCGSAAQVPGPVRSRVGIGARSHVIRRACGTVPPCGETHVACSVPGVGESVACQR